MDDLLLKTVVSFLTEFGKTSNVYSDFLLLTSDFADPEYANRIGEVDFQGQHWPVWVIDCELNLRRAIDQEKNHRSVLVFSTRKDIEITVPPDIKARSHQRGLIPVGLQHTLNAETNRLWPEEVNRDEWKPVIQRHYETLKAIAPMDGFPITRNDLEDLIVKAAFGIDVKGKIAPEIIVGLFRHHKDDKPLELEMEIFRGQLAISEVDQAKVIAWIAEDPGRPRSFLITGAMMRVELQAGLIPGWGDLQQLFGILLETDSQEESLKIVNKLIWDSWNVLHVNEKRSLMSKVEKKLEEDQTVDLEKFNDMLPKSLRYAIESTAEKLAKEGREAYVPIRLENHLFAKDERESLETLRLMARILEQWERLQNDCREERSPIEWIDWYQKNGSFADLEALILIMEGSVKLKQQSNEILNGYWEIRSQVNQKFAEAFLLNYEETIYSKDVFATHKLIDRLLLPILDKKERLFIIVLDGLNYPALIHLTRCLVAADQQDIGIVSEHLAISILPSVTAASRKAIFLGERPVDSLDSEEEYEEKSKKSEEAALKKMLGSFSTKLHNRTTLTASGGQLALFSDLQNANIDFVGVVLNEVDESLSGGVKPRLWDPEDLGVFLEALRDGLNAGRRVFLISDHGHTWHISKEHRQGAQVQDGGQRYLPLESTLESPENTLATSDPNIVHPQQAERIAFLYRVGDYFGHIPRRGYHGGIGLEEIVIPCVELGYGADKLQIEERPEHEKADIESTEVLNEISKGIVLQLSDRRRISVDIEGLSYKQIQALQFVAKHNRITEQQLRANLKTRRIAGIMSELMEKAAKQGFELIRVSGKGSEGDEYEFILPP